MASGKIFMAVMLLTNLMNVALSSSFERPPPFPDIKGYFPKTLEKMGLMQYEKELCEDLTQPDTCNCTACLVQNWTLFNMAEDYPKLSCDVMTTIVEPTTIVATTAATTETPSTAPPSLTRSVTRSSTTTATTTTTTTAATTPKLKPKTQRPIASPLPRTSTVQQTAVNTAETAEETTKTTIAAKAVLNEYGPRISRNAIIAIACGCLLALLAAIAILFALRKLVVGGGKRPKRRRSDRLHLNSNQESAPSTPSPEGKDNISNGYINSAFHSPDGESTDSSGVDYSQYILNPAEPKHDYRTLKVLDHPHALNMGGFGESTDTMTLKKKSTKKRKGSKKTDSNHNRKGSHGGGSVKQHSPDRQRGSVSSKVSVKSRSSDSSKNGVIDRRVSVGALGATTAISLPDGPSVTYSNLKNKEDDEDLLDSNNLHLFAYDNPVIGSSTPSIASIAGGSTILPPPPEFRDDRFKESPFNTTDRGHVDDPPTAIVRPSIKEPPATVVLNRPDLYNVHIPMQDMAPSCPSTFQPERYYGEGEAATSPADGTMATSFLWSLNEKPFVS